MLVACVTIIMTPTVERLAALRLWLKYRTENELREEKTFAVAGVRRLCARDTQ